MTKAQGRRHTRKANYYKSYFDKLARRKAARKAARDKKVAANKAAGKERKPSPSDERRAAARAQGYKSARLRVLRNKPTPEQPSVIEQVAVETGPLSVAALVSMSMLGSEVAA